MKLIIAIVNHHDSHSVQSSLTRDGFSITKLATTGAFLMKSNTTLIIGTDDEKVKQVLDVIRENSEKRIEEVPANISFGIGVATTSSVEVPVGGATVFVVDVAQFCKF